MTLPKWIEEIKSDDFPAVDKIDQDKLIHALEIALEALRQCSNRMGGDSIIKEAMRRIEEIGK